MDEPIGMITSILLFLIILCTALLSGAAKTLLENFSAICWIILLVFAVLIVVQVNRKVTNKVNPVLAFICASISQLSFAFFVMLMARDLALVASEGILGLFGFIILVPLYGIGLAICRVPNILSFDLTADPSLLVFDAVLTPILIIIACWIFGFFDSAPAVCRALFGI